VREHENDGTPNECAAAASERNVIAAALLILAIQLPAPTGPFAVGRTTLPPQVDASRDHRQIVLRLWYPASASDRSAPYLEDVDDDPIFDRSYAFVGLDRLRQVRVHAQRDAPVSRKSRRYPLVLFSHGLGSISFLYTTLIEELASRGYVVAAIEHPNFSAAMRLPDGRIVKNESKRPWFTGTPTPEQEAELLRIRQEEAIVQAEDLRFALTALRSSALRGHIDFRSAGVFGHSRGGFAAAHACAMDDRFDASLNLDGYRLTDAVMDRGLRQPYMHIEEDLPADDVAEVREQRSAFRRMRGGMYHVLVAGTAHASFSDAPLISPDKFPRIRIDAERALAITRAYVVAFFDRHLKGERVPLLDGPSPEYPEATLLLYDGRG
jgi:dienelactone hydrolase